MGTQFLAASGPLRPECSLTDHETLGCVSFLPLKKDDSFWVGGLGPLLVALGKRHANSIIDPLVEELAEKQHSRT